MVVEEVAEDGKRKEAPVQTKIILSLEMALPVFKKYHFAFV
jgi:hypothetical protein